ncbi:mitotic spindle assembly checkpoint protein [Plasmodium gonderi]|uniref:Mitotic spindle assembly checkpoint protein n=1 Tax=Plasmodium gonderi TaxID=77519 RepID=A0A1Y1JBS0_PLAGO|nr:mitotic spindle assembly checkpoint protein [Plasmodium gonderi]GAW79936.1 mitotic spindle assembly checkpoint protein [Plasmodium gonderi]
METYLMEFIEAFTHLLLYVMNIYSSGALHPIKKFLSNNSLYKYRIILKNLKDEILKIYTIEFEQLYQPRRTQISYNAFEQLVWDLFTYVEVQMCETYSTDKTFEISFDLIKDHETDDVPNEHLARDWEIVSYDTLDLFDKKIIKSINVFENGFNPICQVYVEHRKETAPTDAA